MEARIGWKLLKLIGDFFINFLVTLLLASKNSLQYFYIFLIAHEVRYIVILYIFPFDFSVTFGFIDVRALRKKKVGSKYST